MIEIIGKEVEVVKTKLFSFLAMAGGSWGYGLKSSYEIINYFAIILFMLASWGIYKNMQKLGFYENLINKLRDEKCQ